MSFSDLTTASRVRDIIKRQAVGEISKNVPRALIGRVVSVDLPRQTARVWFTGDEQPVSVHLFSSTIPGKWQSQLQPGLTASTNTVGYGSMVSCQRLNGILYITDVLTGGQFSYDLTTMNQKYLSTYAYTDSAASVFGQVIAAKMHVTVVADMTVGQALEFGPFIMKGDQSHANWAKIEVNSSIGNTTYEFTVPGNQFYDGSNFLDRWFRILPKGETSSNLSAQKDYYDLDICYKNTAYGVEPEFNVQSDEIWFRLIPRNTDVTFFAGDVSIETSMFDHPRSVDGNERFVQQVVTIPPDIAGYLGFHNSEMNVFDLFDLKIRDQFDRNVTGSWDTATDGTTWTTHIGSASNYDVVSGTGGRIIASSVSNSYKVINSRLEYDHDALIRFSPSHVAAGGTYQVSVRIRQTATNDWYECAATMQTTGQTDASISKNIAGTITSLASTASVLTHTANGDIWIRAQVRNDKLRMKMWLASGTEPTAWLLTVTDATRTAAGALCLRVERASGNTNSALVVTFEHVECNVSMQARFSAASWATGPWRSGVLRGSQELQKTWTCNGTFTWDDTNSALGWTDEIVFSGIGRHRNGLSQGSAYLTCPRNVSEYVIPVFGNATPTTIAVHANGVVLAAGRSLYVAIPPGERNVDLIENLFLVDSSVNGVDFQLPEWAVLIAHRPLSGNVRLGNGTALWYPWTPTLTNLTQGAGRLIVARYHKANGLVNWRFKFTYGSGSSVGTSPRFTLPFTPHASYVGSEDIVGRGTLLDAGTANYAAVARMVSGSTVEIFRETDTAHQTLTSGAPWTWGTNDVMSVSGALESA